MLRTALCLMRPRSDLSFRTVIAVRPAVVSGERCHVSSIEESTRRSLTCLSGYTHSICFTVKFIIKMDLLYLVAALSTIVRFENSWNQATSQGIQRVRRTRYECAIRRQSWKLSKTNRYLFLFVQSFRGNRRSRSRGRTLRKDFVKLGHLNPNP